MRTDDFDYELPSERIAQVPAEPRDAARLLVCRGRLASHEHRTVRDLPVLLRGGDLLVVNDTRVRPARLVGRRASGGLVELLVLAPQAPTGTWRALARPAGKLRAGEELELEEGRVLATALERLAGDDGAPGAQWLVRLEDPRGELDSVEELLEMHGRMPLPPYVRRPRGEDSRAALDRERYQTVFARESGAVAAPTAGLHLTAELLARLEERGIEHASVTLHVGLGTFRPLVAERIEEHRMHSERFVLPARTAEAIARCRARGGRVIAVGTTVTRVLETRVREDGVLEPGEGETSLYVRPGFRFRAVDALLTNFHLPRSTLLVLVSAFAGRERVLALYREAIAHGYRFFSYGDAMLFLPE